MVLRISLLKPKQELSKCPNLKSTDLKKITNKPKPRMNRLEQEHPEASALGAFVAFLGSGSASGLGFQGSGFGAIQSISELGI